jgi:hypothetical protein
MAALRFSHGGLRAGDNHAVRPSSGPARARARCPRSVRDGPGSFCDEGCRGGAGLANGRPDCGRVRQCAGVALCRRVRCARRCRRQQVLDRQGRLSRSAGHVGGRGGVPALPHVVGCHRDRRVCDRAPAGQKQGVGSDDHHRSVFRRGRRVRRRSVSRCDPGPYCCHPAANRKLRSDGTHAGRPRSLGDRGQLADCRVGRGSISRTHRQLAGPARGHQCPQYPDARGRRRRVAGGCGARPHSDRRRVAVARRTRGCE